MKPSPDMLPGTVDLLVLRTLTRGPLHGYGIAQHIKRLSEEVLRVEEGSLYPALQRLLKVGLVDAAWGVSATNRRVRIYRLTPDGAKHLTREVASYARMFEGINLVLAGG